jgi:hypothetical protein
LDLLYGPRPQNTSRSPRSFPPEFRPRTNRPGRRDRTRCLDLAAPANRWIRATTTTPYPLRPLRSLDRRSRRWSARRPPDRPPPPPRSKRSHATNSNAAAIEHTATVNAIVRERRRDHRVATRSAKSSGGSIAGQRSSSKFMARPPATFASGSWPSKVATSRSPPRARARRRPLFR